ncbi:M56 family metallopeptidase [Dactylosporangium sp. NPDC049140]|uniref:M56 family metallopeptidase n=1 Tax=Dactylosporangium sp. NPDC049140 TaxID=3155647 RepID=UPI0033D6292B
MSPLLLLFAGAVAALAPRLAAADWPVRAPRLAVLVWLALTSAMVSSVALAGLSLALYWDRTHDLVDGAWHVCLDALLGHHGWPGRVAAAAGLLGLVLLAARLALSAWRLLGAQRARRSQLRLLVRVAAVPGALPGATVIDHHEPAAYLMPGSADIIITSAAVEQLGEAELSAVLAHERAHHAGRHYALTHWMRLLSQAFPWVRCLQLGRRQVDRLVELCADDRATRSSSRLDVARALVTMAQPTSSSPPDGLLAIHPGNSMERLQRLLTPPPALSKMRKALLHGAVATLLLAPIGLATVDRYAAWLPNLLPL